MTTPDDKYVVFKKDEFLNGLSMGQPALPLSDAVVIRTKDIFAAPVLYTYAGAVQTAIEVIQAAGGLVPEELMLVREYFHERAQEAAQKIGTLPTP